MPPAKHAVLSASSSHRWLNCSPSARLEQEFEDRETEAAAEGTAAHALCEHKLRRALKLQSRRKPISRYASDEMDMHTDGYVQFVLETLAEVRKNCADPLINIEQRLDFSCYVPDGFGTGDCIIIGDKTMHVINRMLQMNCLRIDDVFIQNLASTCLTCVSDFETVLHDAIRNGQVAGVNLDAGAVSVDLPYEQDSIRWVFYSQLISACIKATKAAKRVLPRRLDSATDKYHANAWLNRLGFGGSEYKELRRTLMGHLNGYAAFKSEDRMQAHKNRLAEQRRIRHEENEEAKEHD